MIQIVNGRWSINSFGDKITTTEHGKEFTDKLNRVKQFSRGKSLTHRKIEVLFKILDTDSTTDNALTKLLAMSPSDIKKIF